MHKQMYGKKVTKKGSSHAKKHKTPKTSVDCGDTTLLHPPLEGGNMQQQVCNHLWLVSGGQITSMSYKWH